MGDLTPQFLKLHPHLRAIEKCVKLNQINVPPEDFEDRIRAWIIQLNQEPRNQTLEYEREKAVIASISKNHDQYGQYYLRSIRTGNKVTEWKRKHDINKLEKPDMKSEQGKLIQYIAEIAHEDFIRRNREIDSLKEQLKITMANYEDIERTEKINLKATIKILGRKVIENIHRIEEWEKKDQNEKSLDEKDMAIPPNTSSDEEEPQTEYERTMAWIRAEKRAKERLKELNLANTILKNTIEEVNKVTNQEYIVMELLTGVMEIIIHIQRMGNKIKNFMQEVDEETYEKTPENTLKSIQENWDKLVRKIQSLITMDNKRFQQIEEFIEENDDISVELRQHFELNKREDNESILNIAKAIRVEELQENNLIQQKEKLKKGIIKIPEEWTDSEDEEVENVINTSISEPTSPKIQILKKQKSF